METETHRTLQLRTNLEEGQEFTEAEMKHIKLLAKLLVDGFNGASYENQDDLLGMSEYLEEGYGFAMSEFIIAAQLVLSWMEFGDIPKNPKLIFLMTTFFHDEWSSEVFEQFGIKREKISPLWMAKERI